MARPERRPEAELSGRLVAAELVASGSPAQAGAEPVPAHVPLQGLAELRHAQRLAELAGTEPVPVHLPLQAMAELRDALAAAIHFNVNDLPAYRAGQLGSAGPGLRRRAWSFTAWMLLVTGLALLAVVAIVVFRGDRGIAILIAGGAAITGVFALYSVFGALNATRDVLGGQLASIEGWGRRMKQTSSRSGGSGGIGTIYYYYVDKQAWIVPPEAYQALIIGQKYRVYYLPRSKSLVAIEPID